MLIFNITYLHGLEIDHPIERLGFLNGISRQRQVYHTDALGSVVAMSDESGAVIQRYSYNAFGAIHSQTGKTLNRITYTARESLGDSLGFYYYRNRVMDSSTGRFISEDPLGFIDGPNRYVYVVNNPMLFLDYFGLQSSCPFAALGANVGNPIWGDLEPSSAGQPEADIIITILPMGGVAGSVIGGVTFLEIVLEIICNIVVPTWLYPYIR